MGKEEKSESNDLKNSTVTIHKPKKWLIVLLSGLFMLILTCMALVKFNIIGIGKYAGVPATPEKSIAVLPFIYDSSDIGNVYFINGVMEDILNDLQKISVLRVVSLTSVQQYNSKTRPSLPEIAKKLNVNYIVEGSGQKSGNKLVIRMQLIAAVNEKCLWGESYEKEIKEPKDIYNIQNRITKAIASELKAGITPEEKELIDKIPSKNLSAYDFYQRGRDELNNYWNGENDYANSKNAKKAEDLFRKALEYDSTFAQVYVGLAWIYWDKYYIENFEDTVLILTNIALSYDDRLVEAYYLKGMYYNKIQKPEKAIEEFDKTLKFNPNHFSAYCWKGWMAKNSGDYVKAIDNSYNATKRGSGKDLPDVLWSLAIIYSDIGFIDKAKYYYHETLISGGDSLSYYSDLAGIEEDLVKANDLLCKVYKLDTTYIGIVNNLGTNYLILGQYKESLECFKKVIKEADPDGNLLKWNMQHIGLAYWQNGFRKEADYYFDKHIETCNNENKTSGARSKLFLTYYDLAGIYAFRGEKDKAYENLRIFNHGQIVPLWQLRLLKADPLFDSIRKEPEFQRIVQDIENRYQAEHERVRKWLDEQGRL
jgi:TolB-like protein/lipopolysaccharide biosynthesis regulator YciM